MGSVEVLRLKKARGLLGLIKKKREKEEEKDDTKGMISLDIPHIPYDADKDEKKTEKVLDMRFVCSLLLRTVTKHKYVIYVCIYIITSMSISCIIYIQHYYYIYIFIIDGIMNINYYLH